MKVAQVCFIVLVFYDQVLHVSSMPLNHGNRHWELIICHTNDIHAHFEQISVKGGRCRGDGGQCYGGTARLKRKIDEIRDTFNNVLLLDAGDQFQGTLWFTRFKERTTRKYMNRLHYDAMAIGNHEFDDSLATLQRFINGADFPVLSSNIDPALEPEMRNSFAKSTVIEIGGKRVGIVGYTTTETPTIASTGNLKFYPEVPSIQHEVDILRENGVNIIIALGHSGIRMDQKIAEEVKGVDVVVGGHTHSFMYTADELAYMPNKRPSLLENGELPSIETTTLDYPLRVNSKIITGKVVPVVQAFEYGKYLGMLRLYFNEDNELVSTYGNPILLDSSIEQDNQVLSSMQRYKDAIAEFGHTGIGNTFVMLEGSRQVCRMQECNLGNAITDAWVEAYQVYPDTESNTYSAMIAIHNSGAIRASLAYRDSGVITTGDISTVLPFGGTVDIVEIKGRYIREALSHSIDGFDPVDLAGKFLQMSGMRVVYDYRNPKGSRVVSAKVLCNNLLECPMPVYQPLEDEKVYRLILNDFMSNGGDGYTMINNNKISHLSGKLDSDVFENHIKKMTPLHTSLDDRIMFMTDDGLKSSAF